MLDKAIRLENYSSTQDGNGRWVESVIKYNVFAKVETKGKGDAKDKGKVSVSFKVLFRPDFKPTGNWRVVYDGQRYQIGTVKKDQEKRFYWVFN